MLNHVNIVWFTLLYTVCQENIFVDVIIDMIHIGLKTYLKMALINLGHVEASHVHEIGKLSKIH